MQVNPEAPAGSFRKRDLQQEERDRASNKARVGLDGKVYQFIDAPSDDENHEAEAVNEGASALAFTSAAQRFGCWGSFRGNQKAKKKDSKKAKKAPITAVSVCLGKLLAGLFGPGCKKG